MRPHALVRTGTVAGALAVPSAAKAASFGAWVFDPERESTPITVFAPDAETAREVRDHLLRVGIDTADGFVTGLDGLELVRPAVAARDEIEKLGPALILDVRTRNEFAAGHVPGARQLSGGRALWEQETLPRDGVILTYCQSDARSCVTASALRRAGFDVVELDGSFSGWVEAGLPVEV